MPLLPNSIPRATNIQQLYDEPLSFLANSRAKLGDILVLREGGPIFSRAADCAGSVAVFGAANHRALLSDIDVFGLPVSAAEHLSLPANLVNLNRGLHSMRDEQHTGHQRLLSALLSERGIEEQHDAVTCGLQTFLEGWRFGQTIPLLAAMRQLALQVSTPLLFGSRYEQRSELASLLQSYFHLRRDETSLLSSINEMARAELLAIGDSSDGALRRYIRWCRAQPAIPADGLLAKLASLELDYGNKLSEDELVAHGNVLFMSSNEPIAVSLTWILLILSQLPDLRSELRAEVERVYLANDGPQLSPTLLHKIINEGLRMLTPNALMVRVTTRPASLGSIELPERCELVLCPFLEHRNAETFPQPSQFLPQRWNGLRPSPFEYFPFGAGGHACVGQRLAMHLLKSALSLLIQRFDLVLARDQRVDWRIHIMLMPRNEFMMKVCDPRKPSVKAGKLFGPVADLVKFDALNTKS